MKYVLAAGGSGGHVIPALKVGDVLQSRGHVVSYMGSACSNGALIDGREFFDHEATSWVGKKGWAKAQALFVMGRAIVRCWRRLRECQPDAVAGFGGFGAFPAVFAASRMNIPTIFHEQNVVPGQANRRLARDVSMIALSFEQREEIFPKHKIVVTGCPCHYNGGFVDTAGIYEEFGLTPGRFTILVMGGSQGSQVLNHVVPEALVKGNAHNRWQCVHCAGPREHDHVRDVYARARFPHAVFPFLTRMDKAYAIADVVISRSGALTVSEILAYQRRAVLVPYPHALAHQLANACWLRDQGLARILPQREMTLQSIIDLVQDADTQSWKLPQRNNSGSPTLPENAIADVLERISQ
jgi:UDP-N-acetylglucosamine--N-acetylmuramyl-(pentapeptide) pyrophosphoryl-undecaprenol N-acetylglucosamine transferase